MKVKALLSFFVSIFCIIYTYAEKVDLEKAEKVARSYVSSTPRLHTRQHIQFSRTVSKELQPGQPLRSASEEAMYYVFSMDGNEGFIIVSADDVAVPVLGYSEQGSYDESNPNFAYWMECLAQEIAYGIENNIPQNEATKAQWDAYIARNIHTLRASTAVGPILTTQWNQTSPYNNLCPYNAVTGCVATAMAQVMKHHNYPIIRTIEIPAYTTGTNQWAISAIGTTTYDWTNMTNTYSSSSTQTQEEAVATLMYHCGASVKMNYTTVQSGTTMTAASLAFPTYFDYDQCLQRKQRKYYSNNDWEALLEEEILNDRPVFYVGFNLLGGGHAFVCDGYDDTGKFHFNWGWGGTHDGYFVTTALNPGLGGIGAGWGAYNQNQEILINVIPNYGGTKSYEMKIFHETNISASETTLDPGQTFTVNAPVCNMGIFNFTGDVGIAIVDASDNIQDVIGQISVNLDHGSCRTGPPIRVTIPTTASPGSCRIRVVYKASDASQWSITTGTPGYIDVLDLTITDNPPQTHGIKIANSGHLQSSKTTINQGEIFNVSADYKNISSTTVTGYCGMALVDNSDQLLAIIGIDLLPRSFDSGMTITSYVINCAISAAINPGSYNIRAIFKPTGEDWSFIDGESPIVTDIVPITVLATTVTDNSSIFMNSEFTVSSNPVDQFSPLVVTVNVGITGGASNPFYGELELGLYDTSNDLTQTLLEVIGKEQTALSFNTRTFTFNLSSVSLPKGTYYLSLYQKGIDGVRKKVNRNQKNNNLPVTVGIPPQIVAISPADGATDVPVKGLLILTFDKPMNTTDVGVVTLDGGIVSYEYKNWSSNNTVCAIYYSELTYYTTYTFNNISAFQDNLGNVMNAVTSGYSFTTMPPPPAFTTWDPQNNSTDWTDSDNWTDGVPGATTKATIPESSFYPILTVTDYATVGEILFQPGAELGRQDLLDYQKAYVQLDFSASASRNRWWMLSNPLQELYAGDFTFGGLPEMAIQRYANGSGQNITLGTGEWQSLASEYEYPFKAGDSFALWLTDDDDSSQKQGLSVSDGIITLPYFENPDEEDVHWTHKYNPTLEKSTFYEWDGTTPSVSVDRTNDAYRLVDTDMFTKDLDFGLGESGLYYYAATGNPFMSSIDFTQLLSKNTGLGISDNYWVWVGAGETDEPTPGSYAIYNKTGGYGGPAFLSNTIPPMQSFIVENISEIPSNPEITFDITTISATGNADGLRATAPSNDLLEIIASTPKAAVRAVIASHEQGSPVFSRKDGRKLLAGINSLPEIYLLKPATDNRIVKVAADIVNEIEAEWMIPLGIATTYEGPITLSFAGMDTYNARIFLIDTASPDKQEIELTGKAKYEYTFDYKPEIVKGTAVSNENRFFILLAPTVTTGIEQPAALSKILVYSNRESTIQALSGEWIQQVSVFNIQGQKIYDNAAINAREHTVTGLVPGVYAATVVTKNEVKTAKIIVR